MFGTENMVSSRTSTWFNDIGCPTFTNFDERCVSSICRIVNSFMNSRNIVDVPSSILGQPYLICLENGCLKSVCENVIILQI